MTPSYSRAWSVVVMRQECSVQFRICFRFGISLGLLGLLANVVVGGFLGEPVWAQSGSGAGTVNRTHRRSGGTRGCTLAAPGGETLGAVRSSLVLLGAEGVMKAGAPSALFAWYVRDRGSWPLEFRIYRQRPDAPNEEAELVVALASDAVVSQPGIMTLALPDHLPPLEPGLRYWWQVELTCDPQDASANIFAEAELEVSSQGRLMSHGLGQERGQTLGLWLRAKTQGEVLLLPQQPDWEHWGLTVAEAQAAQTVDLGQMSWVVLPPP